MKSNLITKHKNCRGCLSNDVRQFFDLGKMPLAGGFISKKEVPKEIKISLKVYFCLNCGLVQILDVVNPNVLFKKYYYISSVIKSLSEHFKHYSIFLKKHYLNKKGSKLLEFGSNDGVLLQNFKKDKNILALGIDPSSNITKLAKKKGLKIVTDFFNEKAARKLLRKYGPVDVVTGSNVFAHIDDIHEIINAAKIIMKPNGVFIIEVHYLGDLVKYFQYDTIYHEHLSYYSVSSLKKIFSLQNLKILNVIHLEMHGGGIRVVAAHQSSNLNPLPSINKFLKQETEQKLTRFSSFLKFGEFCKSHRRTLRTLLDSYIKRGYSIVGYGAPGRGTILLNYCAIDKEILKYIVDISPLRVGRLMPGVHIPIRHIDKARKNPPNYFLVLAWNYIDSILKQERLLRKKGVKFIVPFPKIEII